MIGNSFGEEFFMKGFQLLTAEFMAKYCRAHAQYKKNVAQLDNLQRKHNAEMNLMKLYSEGSVKKNV